MKDSGFPWAFHAFSFCFAIFLNTLDESGRTMLLEFLTELYEHAYEVVHHYPVPALFVTLVGLVVFARFAYLCIKGVLSRPIYLEPATGGSKLPIGSYPGSQLLWAILFRLDPTTQQPDKAEVSKASPSTPTKKKQPQAASTSAPRSTGEVAVVSVAAGPVVEVRNITSCASAQIWNHQFLPSIAALTIRDARAISGHLSANKRHTAKPVTISDNHSAPKPVSKDMALQPVPSWKALGKRPALSPVAEPLAVYEPPEQRLMTKSTQAEPSQPATEERRVVSSPAKYIDVGQTGSRPDWNLTKEEMREVGLLRAQSKRRAARPSANSVAVVEGAHLVHHGPAQDAVSIMEESSVKKASKESRQGEEKPGKVVAVSLPPKVDTTVSQVSEVSAPHQKTLKVSLPLHTRGTWLLRRPQVLMPFDKTVQRRRQAQAPPVYKTTRIYAVALQPSEATEGVKTVVEQHDIVEQVLATPLSQAEAISNAAAPQPMQPVEPVTSTEIDVDSELSSIVGKLGEIKIGEQSISVNESRASDLFFYVAPIIPAINVVVGAAPLPVGAPDSFMEDVQEDRRDVEMHESPDSPAVSTEEVVDTQMSDAAPQRSMNVMSSTQLTAPVPSPAPVFDFNFGGSETFVGFGAASNEVMMEEVEPEDQLFYGEDNIGDTVLPTYIDPSELVAPALEPLRIPGLSQPPRLSDLLHNVSELYEERRSLPYYTESHAQQFYEPSQLWTQENEQPQEVFADDVLDGLLSEETLAELQSFAADIDHGQSLPLQPPTMPHFGSTVGEQQFSMLMPHLDLSLDNGSALEPQQSVFGQQAHVSPPLFASVSQAPAEQLLFAFPIEPSQAKPQARGGVWQKNKFVPLAGLREDACEGDATASTPVLGVPAQDAMLTEQDLQDIDDDLFAALTAEFGGETFDPASVTADDVSAAAATVEQDTTATSIAAAPTVSSAVQDTAESSVSNKAGKRKREEPEAWQALIDDEEALSAEQEEKKCRLDIVPTQADNAVPEFDESAPALPAPVPDNSQLTPELEDQGLDNGDSLAQDPADELMWRDERTGYEFEMLDLYPTADHKPLRKRTVDQQIANVTITQWLTLNVFELRRLLNDGADYANSLDSAQWFIRLSQLQACVLFDADEDMPFIVQDYGFEHFKRNLADWLSLMEYPALKQFAEMLEPFKKDHQSAREMAHMALQIDRVLYEAIHGPPPRPIPTRPLVRLDGRGPRRFPQAKRK